MTDERRDWEELAEVDPLWTVLSDPTRKGGRWQLDEFLATGEQEVSETLERARQLGFPRASERALDVGCGAGRITRALAGRFDACLGIDVSEAMVRYATRVNTDRLNCSFRRLGADDLAELEGDSFDLVWCVLVLQHLPSASAELAVTSLISLVRPGGVAIFQLPYTTRTFHRLQLARRGYRALRRTGVSADVLLRRTALTPMRMTTVPEQRVSERVRAGGGELIAAEPHGDPAAATPSRIYFAARRDDVSNNAVTGAD